MEINHDSRKEVVSNIVTHTKNGVNSLFTLKLVVTIVMFIVSMPIISHYYWIFETSYLSALGIDPEIFSRPIFSSNTMNAILFFTSIVPVMWSIAILLLGFLMFVLLDGLFESTLSYRNNSNEAIKRKFGRALRMLSKAKFNGGYLSRLFVIWFVCSLGFVFTALYAASVQFVRNKGYSIAEYKMSGYLKENPDCIGSWSRRVSGCYTIEGVEGEDHYVVLNNDTHIVFFSRELVEIKEGEEKLVAKLHIKEKTPSQKYETSRSYKPHVPKVAAE